MAERINLPPEVEQDFRDRIAGYLWRVRRAKDSTDIEAHEALLDEGWSILKVLEAATRPVEGRCS